MNRKIKRQNSVVFTDLDDGSGVLLHLENKFYYSLNPTGSFIWKLLEEKEELSEDSILEAVIDNFEVDEKEARKDVEEFLNDLIKEGLVIREEVKV